MPRNITITFADGTSHVYQGAPDDVTPDQVEARAAKEFGKKVTALDGGRGEARPAPSDEPGLLTSAAAGLGKGVGQVALGAQDLIGQGLSAVGADRVGGWLQRDATQGRAKLEQELKPYAEANPVSAKVGEMGGQIAATLPVGGALAKGLSSIPGVASAVPGLVSAVRSSGMTAGNATGATNALLRAAGGAITGGTSAALVDQQSAGTGALVGAALPGAMQLAGMAGTAVRRTLRGPEQTQDLAAAVQSARQSGYVIPPTQARPTLANRLLEGFSGKLTTAQNASAKNQSVTNSKAAAALGLPADAKITPDVLQTVRNQAGQAYDAIGSTGAVTPSQSYMQALDDIAAPFVKTAQGFPNAKPSPVLELVESLKSPTFDAAAAVEKIKQLRSAADDAFRSGAPGATDLARASRKAAGALEDALEGHLQQIGQPQLLQEFRDGRQLIAKTYSVEKALNPETGTIDARKLAAQLQKGKPLSGELKDAAGFASRFPKASQTIEGMGSLPQTSPLDWGLAGGLSMATSNPLLLATALARPAARATTLSPLVQNRLIQPPAGAGMAGNLAIQKIFYRGAPVLAADE